ncbi:MAG: asparaginase [Natronospirillum sp.]
MPHSNPTLVHITRGGAVESMHRGRALVMRSNGDVLWSVGDVEELTYPRSAIKAFQALPMVASGAVEALGISDEELALCCASHNGEDRHTAVADAFLQRLNLAEPAFECGTHWPMGQQATIDLAWRHTKPDARHNNCSGKHLGMLALAVHKGWNTQGYVKPEHPVQQAIKACIEDCCTTSLDGVPLSPDGCTAPTWAMPLHRLALGFARFADQSQLPAQYQAAARALHRAATQHPFLVAGTERYCTEVMAALGDEAFLKVGAEGVYIAALPRLKLGVAIKMDSGSAPAAEVAMSAILRQLGFDLPEKWQSVALRNRNGLLTGAIAPVESAYADLKLA